MKLTLTPERVRADAIRFLSNTENVSLRDGTPFDYKDHLVSVNENQNTVEHYLQNMSQQGTYGDHVTLTAIACTCNVQFIVISSLGEKATRVIAPSINSSHDKNLPTAFLGHLAEDQGTHYVGLLPESKETLTTLIQNLTSPTPTVPVRTSANKTATRAAESDHGTPNDLGLKCSGPKQPHLVSFPKTKFGKQSRAFSASYYSNYPWLEYSIDNDAVFCFPCRHFYTDRRFVEDLFVSKGMKDWKKINEKLSKHAGSQSYAKVAILSVNR